MTAPASTDARRAFSVAVFARRGGPDGRLLVIHHRRLDTWLPVGGELDPGETPLDAARRELREETGLTGVFPALAGAVSGTPDGYLGYEEHQAGSKGLHMNFVFVADVADDAEVTPNHEFSDFRWVDAAALEALAAPENVHQLGRMALAARPR
ncbi:NUDIX domain-containing protein [Haliangium sp.]|uniref:NUDIX domain-containing protein n=1 Tax=Haliangium sp. TaxID=2663208 RepID=UPI003D0F9429